MYHWPVNNLCKVYFGKLFVFIAKFINRIKENMRDTLDDKIVFTNEHQFNDY